MGKLVFRPQCLEKAVRCVGTAQKVILEPSSSKPLRPAHSRRVPPSPGGGWGSQAPAHSPSPPLGYLEC